MSIGMKWIKYDLKHQPPKRQEVLVTDGINYDFAKLIDEYYLSNDKPTGCSIWSFTKGPQMYYRPLKLDNITHWAELKMPEKENKKIGR